jgi:hypothetical protein
MNARKIGVICVVCVFAMSGLMIGCGSSNGGNGEKTFKAYIQHFGGDDYVNGMEVEALSNSTGDSLGITATSDATGWVTFNWGEIAVEPKVGFLCKGVAGDWRDTYQFDIDSEAQDERLWALDETTWVGAPLMAGITMIPGKALVAGGVYWEDKTQDMLEVHLGCATVKANPEDGDVRYFGDNGMPTTLELRENTNPLVAYYVVANMTPGAQLIEAFVDTTKIGETDLFVYGDAVSISNIYADPDQPNPMPTACE